MRTGITLVVAGLLVSGCYTISPIAMSAPQPGYRLITHLSEPIEFQVVEARLTDLVSVEGQLLRQTPDSLVLAARTLSSRSGIRHPALGAPVSVYKPHVTQIQRKKVSGIRSALLFIAGGAALAGLLFTLDSAGGGTSNGNGGGGRL